MNDSQSLKLEELPDLPDLENLASQAHQASVNLAQTPVQSRNLALKELLGNLQAQQDAILEANTLDLETMRDLATAGFGAQWLKLTPERLALVRQYLEALIGLPDPLQVRSGTVAQSLYSFSGYRTMPQGLVCGLYEFLPEFPVLLASLCLKTGNSLWLRGSAETNHTHQFLASLIDATLKKAKLDPQCFHSFAGDRTLPTAMFLTASLPIDLIVPYGRASFMDRIAQAASVPVLKPAMGNCYLLWSPSGSSDFVRTIIVDSHLGMPDAVNAIEKVLITPNINSSLLNVVFHHLREKGFTLKGDAALTADFPELTLAEPSEWSTPYFNKTVAFKVVESLGEGIRWINRHSSGHADGLVTDVYRESQQFILTTDSATAFINASPKFSRLTSGPNGTVALGMMGRSTSWGAISVETFLKGNRVVQGLGTMVTPLGQA
jgi:glutamate-5-semialdehyde dehydrogenase